ncbi:MAG: cytochrome P450 [Candidatus Acidiferrales bacterium]
MSEIRTSYLSQYDAAAEKDKFRLVRGWIDKEPLPFFKELRERRPVLVTPVCTLLARFHDVTEILNMPKVFTVQLYVPKMVDYLMAHDDDALHSREKAIMQSMLNRDDLPKVREMVAKIARGILDKANGRIEVVKEYCRMVPATLVQEYFGLDGVEQKDLIDWSFWNQYDTFDNHPFDSVPSELQLQIVARHKQVNEKLATYVKELIARRLVEVKAEEAGHILLFPWYLLRKLVRLLLGQKKQAFKDDIVARMLRTSYPDAVDFDIQRLGINAGGLLIGSIETTSQAVAQVIQFLMDRPESLADAVSASQRNDLKLFDAIVWEALRFVPISPFLFRQAAQDFTVCKGTEHATTIRAGTTVLALTQSAMFDTAAFENPDQFLAGRDWYHYFHFGFASHECLGKYIGMVMIPEMVRQVVTRPGIKALGAIDYQSSPFPEQFNLSWSS